MNSATKTVMYGGSLVILFLVSQKNYLLFHSLAELFSIVIAFGIFVIGWNSRKYYKNNYLLFIGIAYLFVAFFDTLHTLAYKGMAVFKGYDDNNIPPQLWLVARYMESVALLLAPFFFSRLVRQWRIISVFTAVSAIAIYAIFLSNIFPDCFVTGSGLTTFKIGSEYLIDLILCAALYLLHKKREHFEPGVLRLLTLSIVCTMATELCFTVYVHLYGISNLVGHFFKILSFWFMYRAIIETSLGKPYDLLFRELHTKEVQFANAFHYAPIGIALVAPDGRWLKVNHAVCVMVGYTEDELLSRTFQDITHPDDLETDLSQVHQILDGTIKSYQLEKRYLHKNGTIIWALLSVSLVRDDEGNIQHFIKQLLDVTERKTIENVQKFLSERGWRSREEGFFPALARFLSETLSLEFICIDRLIGDGHTARTVAVYHNGRFEDNVEYALKDTPCGDVVGKTVCCFPHDVANLFPNDPVLQEIKAESYAGITLWDKDEGPIGLIALIGEKPFANPALIEAVLQYVAPRASGEMERGIAEQMLLKSESKFRGLFNHIPMSGVIWRLIRDEQQEIVDWEMEEINERGAADIGKSSGELSGKRAVDLFGSEVMGAYLELCRSVIASNQPKQFETFFAVNNRHYLTILFAIGTDYYVNVSFDITERKRAEDVLRESEERFSIAFNNAPIMISISKLEDGTFLDVNQRFLDTSGFSRDEVIGKTSIELGWVSEEVRNKLKEAMLRDGRVAEQEFGLRTKSGKSLTCTFWGEMITLAGKKRLLSIAVDITEQRTIERQFIQSQKMESIGRLAGGVAHDFNNMLGVILGHAELGLMHLDPTNPVCDNLKEISNAAERSADLTRQLLAFARKQTIAPKVLDLNETVSGMLKMLQRLIGEDIHLNWRPAPALWRIKADPSQIDQVLANLCVNARDAIKNTGEIIIETKNNTIDAEYCENHPDVVPGEYVHLSVIDNGNGMDNDTVEHIFEPFFTTKAVGDGTGLGLATVYGIITQNNGFITVSSQPGAGTTFSIHLPRFKGIESQTPNAVKAAPLPTGHETIILVEDEPAILTTTAAILEMHGYTVLKAETPGEALKIASGHAGQIQLLLTDVIMPGMNGRDLAGRLQSIHPEVKLLFMSGYTADIIAHHGVLDDGVNFIPKPFKLPDLTTKVREVLDKPRTPS